MSWCFHVNLDNKVPSVSLPNAWLRNDAHQSDAVGRECDTQVYERRAVRSPADVNHTHVQRTTTIRDSALKTRARHGENREDHEGDLANPFPLKNHQFRRKANILFLTPLLNLYKVPTLLPAQNE